MICKWTVFLFLAESAGECVVESNQYSEYPLVDEFKNFADHSIGVIQSKRTKGSELFEDAIASFLRTKVDTLNPDYLWNTVFESPTEVPDDPTVKQELTQLGIYLLPFFFPLMIAVGCLICLLPCVACGNLSDTVSWSLMIPQAKADKWLKNQQYSRRHHYPRKNRLCLTLCTAALGLTIVLGCLLAAATTRSLDRTLKTSTCKFDGIIQQITEGSTENEDTRNFVGVLNVDKVMDEIGASVDLDVVVNELEILGQAVDNYSRNLKSDVLSLGSIMALNINEPVIRKWYHYHSTKPIGEMLMLYSVGWNPSKIRTTIFEPLVSTIKDQEDEARAKIQVLSNIIRDKSDEWSDTIVSAKEFSEESTKKVEKGAEIFIIFLYASTLFLLFITGLTILFVVPAIWRFSRLNIFNDRHLKALWIFLTLSSILSVIIGGLTLPISVLISDGCFWVNDLKDPKEFEAFLEKSHLTGSLVSNITETCFLPANLNKGSNLISNLVISNLPLEDVRQQIQELSDLSFEGYPELEVIDFVELTPLIMGLFLLDRNLIENSEFADLANNPTMNCGTLENDITLDFDRFNLPKSIGYSDICGIRTVENIIQPFFFNHLNQNATNKTFRIRSSPMRDFTGTSYDADFASAYNLAQFRQGLFDETFTCGWNTEDSQCSFFQYVHWITKTSNEVETKIRRQYQELTELLDSQKSGIASLMTQKLDNVENILESANCGLISKDVESFIESSCGETPSQLFGISFLFCLISLPFLGLALMVYSLSKFRREYKEEIKNKPQVLQPPPPQARQVNQMMPYGYMSPMTMPQGQTMYAVPLPLQAWPQGMQQYPVNYRSV